MTIQLNLLPDVKKEYLKAQKSKALVMSASVLVTLCAIGLSVLLFLYVTFGQQIQIGLIDNDIKSKTTELNNIQDIDKYLTIQNQLKALPELHDQKGIYSRLFNFLAIMNPSPPNNVKLSVLQLSAADQSLVLTGTTASFESLNVFVDTLNNAEVTYKEPGAENAKTDKIFDSIVVQSSALARVNNATNVSFTILAKYKLAAFDARNTDVNAKVPNIQTTPSITGSPASQQLFQEGQ